MTAEVIPLPALEIRQAALLQRPGCLLRVEHEGCTYLIATLLARLPDEVLDWLDDRVPQPAQECWDAVVRQRPKVVLMVMRQAQP